MACERALAGEVRVLALIRSHISLALLQPFPIRQDLMAYPLLPGEALTRQGIEI